MQGDRLWLTSCEQPKLARQWIILQLLQYNFRTYTDNNGVEATDWDIIDSDMISTLIRISTSQYSISCKIRTTSEYSLLFTIMLKNGGKKRITYQIFKSDFMDIKIPSEHVPHCPVCDRDICVYFHKEHSPTFRTLINYRYVRNDRFGRGTREVVEKGHDKYHQKIAREVDKLYKRALHFIEIVSESLKYNGSLWNRSAAFHNMLTVITQHASFWHSRFVFQCIWTFHREKTLLELVPRDVFLMISEMIYSPRELRHQLAVTANKNRLARYRVKQNTIPRHCLPTAGPI